MLSFLQADLNRNIFRVISSQSSILIETKIIILNSYSLYLFSALKSFIYLHLKLSVLNVSLRDQTNLMPSSKFQDETSVTLLINDLYLFHHFFPKVQPARNTKVSIALNYLV